MGVCFGSFYILKASVTRLVFGEKFFGQINGAIAFPYLSMFALSASTSAFIWQWFGYLTLLIILSILLILGFVLACLIKNP